MQNVLIKKHVNFYLNRGFCRERLDTVINAFINSVEDDQSFRKFPEVIFCVL